MNVDNSFNFQDPALPRTYKTQHPPVGKLPVELLLHIFRQCEPGFETALILSHICHYWRAIALDVGSLWTEVDISLDPKASTKAFNAFLCCLGLQLDRTAQLPLEVFWRRDGSDCRTGVIEDLVRRKGHFSRWRSLRFRFEYDPQDVEPTLSSTDVFTNLEYLEVLSPSRIHPIHPYEHHIIHFIDRTITSKFHTLNLGPSLTPSGAIGRLYGNILGQARTLITCQGDFITDRDLLLPVGVTALEVESRLVHSFPHIKIYRLRKRGFSSRFPVNLQRLTSLTVDVVILLDGIVILLPALQSITFSVIKMIRMTEFKCPSLQSMHIRAIESPVPCTSQFSHLQLLIRHPGYFLSPKLSLTIEKFFPPDITIELVELAPDVEHLSFSFNDERCALRVLEAIGSLVEGSRSSSTQTARGLSRLVELRARLFWEGCDTEIWRGHVAEIMEKYQTGEGPTLMHVSKCKDDNHAIVLRRRDR